MRDMSFFDAWEGKDEWECPSCDYCGSIPETHIVIFENVKNTRHILVECPVCKLRFYSPRRKFSAWLKHGFGVNDSAKAEALNYTENIGFAVVEDREKQKQLINNYYSGMLRNIVRLNGLPESVFEVGCASGFFLDAACDMGVKKFGGVEVNSFYKEIVRKKYGFDILHADFSSYVPVGDLYGCGVMLDYIEHSFVPFQDLKKMSSMIKLGGSFLLKTFLEELDVNRTMEAPIGHEYHLFGNTLKNMLMDAGFEILDWDIRNIMVIAIGRKTR